MLITDRDLVIIRWINSHRLVTAEHVKKKFLMSRQSAYRRLKILVEAGYLAYERIFISKPGVYRVTQKGVAVSEDDLPPKGVCLGTYHHDIEIVTLAINLEERTGGKWVPERRIRQELGLKGVGQAGHVPDGFLLLPDKRVAVEMEQTKKGDARMAKIISYYKNEPTIAEVWYFCCTDTIVKRVSKAVSETGKFKIIKWPEMTEIQVGPVQKPEGQISMDQFFWGVKNANRL
ncbi:MAG: hypothetical protein A4E56_01897 [Pelotomaculum sp. PtaU1.Bin065]|nr:MAG: hypothetical protein A4E56_01897 [Pelotomaculum sp. PtaU1.Bin065]